MVLALPVLAALVVGLLLGGSLLGLTNLRLRHGWLFFAAIGLQVVAFPFPFLPWTTPDVVATTIWLLSYCTLGVAAVANARVPGVLIVAAGMLSNVVAIVANGGHMPSLPSAVAAAGGYAVQYNSALDADPLVPWLVDRWAMPHWIPGGNVFSVGDVVIAIGAFVVVTAAMRPFRAARRSDPILAFLDGLGDVEAAAVATAMRAVARRGPGIATARGAGVLELCVDAEGRTLALLFAESGPDRQVLLAIEDAGRMDEAARLDLARRRLADWHETHGDAPAPTSVGRGDFLAELVARRTARDATFAQLVAGPAERRGVLPRTATPG